MLVGHSFGGLNTALFARRYRYLTAALVLVDASHPDQVKRFLAPTPFNMLTAPSSRYGIVQYRDPPPARVALPEAIKREIGRRAAMRRTRRTLGNELLSFRDSARQVRQSPDLANLPLLVIRRGKVEDDLSEKRFLLEALWLQLQIELASANSASTHSRTKIGAPYPYRTARRRGVWYPITTGESAQNTTIQSAASGFNECENWYRGCSVDQRHA